MQHDKKSALLSSPELSGTSERGRCQPPIPVLDSAENLESLILTDTVNHSGPLKRASRPVAKTSATSNTAMPRPTAEISSVLSSRNASRLPVPNVLVQGDSNHDAPHMALLANHRRTQTCANDSFETQRTSLPPHVPYATSLSSSGSESTLTERSSENCGHLPWFDGPEYQSLYKEIRHQAFDGYECTEKDMVQPAYRIPNRSIKAVLQYMDMKGPRSAAFAGQNIDSEHVVGFSKSELFGVSQRHEGLTLGEAIQELYISRLRESNRLLPMTKVYEGGWTSRLPGKQPSKKVGTVWLGDVVDSVNFELLEARDVTAMVSIHPRDFRSRGQEEHGRNGEIGSHGPIRWHLQIQLADSKEADLEAEFETVFEFIQQHVNQGHNLLVHCIAGLSRSVAVVRDFIQRIEVNQGSVDMTGTAAERYLRMKQSREATFQRLKMMRPGITEENFKDQLDNSTMKICGLPRQSKGSAGSKQKSKEHGGGVYLGDAVAMVFFLYRLRPTPQVIQLFEKRRKDHDRKEKDMGKMRNGFSFHAPMVEWFQECVRDLSSAPERTHG